MEDQTRGAATRHVLPYLIEVSMGLVVDHREVLLIQAMEAKLIPHTVRTLDVGDVMCEGSNAWIVERKMSSDLSRSIISGFGVSKRPASLPQVSAPCASSRAICEM